MLVTCYYFTGGFGVVGLVGLVGVVGLVGLVGFVGGVGFVGVVGFVGFVGVVGFVGFVGFVGRFGITVSRGWLGRLGFLRGFFFGTVSFAILTFDKLKELPAAPLFVIPISNAPATIKAATITLNLFITLKFIC